MKWTRAKVLQVSPLTNTIIQVQLQPQDYISYRAGQYLQLKTGDYCAYFSIANAPLGAQIYELHIRHDKSHASSQQILKHVQQYGEVDIQLPFGECHLGALHATRPILFIAGGTGFAPIKAIIEQLLYSDDQRIFECYWGAKEHSDLYLQSKLKDWKKQVDTFEHLLLVEGKDGCQILDTIIERHQQKLLEMQLMISGSFDMVYACRDRLLQWGLESQYIHSDAFEFEQKS